MLCTAPMAGPLGSSKHRWADDSRTLRRISRSRNTMVTVRVRVGRMLGAPVSRSASGRRRWRRAASTNPDAPRPRARVRPRGRAGGGHVLGLRDPRARGRAHPLRRLRARIPARVLKQVPVLLSELPRQVPRRLDAVAGYHAPRARAAPAGRPHHPEAAACLWSLPSTAPRRARPRRPRRRPHGHGRDPHADRGRRGARARGGHRGVSADAWVAGQLASAPPPALHACSSRTAASGSTAPSRHLRRVATRHGARREIPGPTGPIGRGACSWASGWLHPSRQAPEREANSRPHALEQPNGRGNQTTAHLGKHQCCLSTPAHQ